MPAPNPATGLTRKQREFCEALVADPDRNQARAARKAGYKSPIVEGSRLLTRANVKAYIAKLEKSAVELANKKTRAAVASRAEVLERMTRRARLKLGEFVTIGPDGAVIVHEDKIREAEGLIEGIEVDARGNPKLRFSSPQAADKALLDHYDAQKDDQLPQIYEDRRTFVVNLLTSVSREQREKLFDLAHRINEPEGP